MTKQQKTHCARGHAYDEANTRWATRDGARVCRICQSGYVRSSRLRKKYLACSSAALDDFRQDHHRRVA